MPFIRVPGSESVRLRRSTIYFTRVQPLLNRGVLLRNYLSPNGNIIVSVLHASNDFDRIYCKVGPTEASVLLPTRIDFSQADPAGVFRLSEIGTTGVFQHSSVPVTGIPATAPRASDQPNQWISIGAYVNSNADNLLDDDTFPFVAVPSASTASVSGKGCLFLAYTDPAATLPGLGLSIPTNRPTSLTAPIDASNLFVNVPQAAGVNQKWNNHSTLCGPSGEPTDVDATPTSLITAALSSDGMTQLISPPAPPEYLLDGVLAGMWDFGAAKRGQRPACVELPIGVGLDDGTNSASLGVPELIDGQARFKPFNLLLGLHSEKWDGTTGGALNVALTWS